MNRRSRVPSDSPHRRRGAVAPAAALLGLLLLAPLAAAHEDPPEPPGDAGAAAAAVACVNGKAGIYPCHDVDLVAFLPRDQMGVSGLGTIADLWGWTDPETGVEYALVGHSAGTAFVSLEDPASPLYLGQLPGRTLAVPWRDLKVYRNHVYVVADAPGHGVQVFNLTRLRNTRSPRTWEADAVYAGPGFGALGGFILGNAHNIAINEERGFAYALGSDTCDGGLHMIDLANPVRPRFAGCFGETGYIHDTQCVVSRRGDPRSAPELCFNANISGLTIVDVSDKGAPRLLGSVDYPGARYAHQGWLTEDHHYFLLGDEVDELANGHFARTYVFDVSDTSNPRLAGSYTSPEPVTDHNLYVHGDFVYEANYFAGLRILEMEDLSRGELREVAYFDTVPDRQELGFGGGAWSVYPFFDSDLVIVSSVAEGLFVLRPRIHHGDGHGGLEGGVHGDEPRTPPLRNDLGRSLHSGDASEAVGTRGPRRP